MQIELKEVSIRDISNGYTNDVEEGVTGYSGQLNIRPKYQREFIYKSAQRNAVIDTVRKDFPLSVLYWVESDDGTYEVMDGQQRTISICEYISGGFALNHQHFHNLEEEEQEQILNYKLMIYFCHGENREKLDWLKIINTAGEKLTRQELRNAIYTGSWLTDAKKHFSKQSCPAYDIAHKYVKGLPIRQDYLETAIDWISDGEIEQYMADNQHEASANELWLYFQSVINWVNVIFPTYRKEMKGIPFGNLYNIYKDVQVDPAAVEIEITNLMLDEDVTKKSGVYKYILTRDEKYLNIRSFTDSQKREAYEKQEGICIKCGEHFELDEMEADHITPWCDGGKTISENCQMLCKHDNRIKSAH